MSDTMQTGDYVEIKDAVGAGNWHWAGRKGHITEVDRFCFHVRTDSGESIRDVHEHFRPTQ